MKSYHQLIRHSGNLDLFRAVEMSVTALMNGVPFHIHAEGLRGTGKTSIIRAAKNILPHIERIKGCIYNCQPSNPHCPQHMNMTDEQVAAIGAEMVPCPFLEISHAAKVGTVVGSIDLGRLTNRLDPVAALLPGTIPQAHRGVIFIDEINRLADTSPEVADVLLSVMGTKPGRVQIEESGLPVVDIPVSVSVWAASNPDEEPGCLTQVRRQLADRFDVVVSMGRPNDYRAVSMILGNQNFDPVQTNKGMEIRDSGLMFAAIQTSEQIRSILASIYVDFGLESLRAIEAVETGARLNALLSGRSNVQNKDLISIVPLALGHRTDSGAITSILKYLENLEKSQSVNPSSGLPENSVSSALPLPRTVNEINNEPFLQKIWRKLKSMLKSSTSNRQLLVDNKQSNPSTPPQPNGSMSGGPQNSPADPLKSDINAPAKAAVPLVSMKLEKYVSDEDNQGHGR